MEEYVRVIQDMYFECETSVVTTVGKTDFNPNSFKIFRDSIKIVTRASHK